MTAPISMLTGAVCTSEELDRLDADSIEFAVSSDSWHDGFDVYMRGTNMHLDPTDRRTKYTVIGLSLKIPPDPVVAPSPPAFTLCKRSAQQLMDELWKAGIRPSDDTAPTPATLDAVNKHLQDMRKLVFDFVQGKVTLT